MTLSSLPSSTCKKSRDNKDCDELWCSWAASGVPSRTAFSECCFAVTPWLIVRDRKTNLLLTPGFTAGVEDEVIVYCVFLIRTDRNVFFLSRCICKKVYLPC